jgi:hypothetical protein
MKVKILCPGPSLADVRDVAGDLIIGVNRAALAHECDVWAAMDFPMIGNYSPKGRPILFTKRETKVLAPERFLSILYADDLDGPTFLWQKKTMICAMVFALRVGNASKIDLFGFDAAGTKDYDGKEAGEDRSDKRWTDELKTYEQLVDWLGHNGCTVVRH